MFFKKARFVFIAAASAFFSARGAAAEEAVAARLDGKIIVTALDIADRQLHQSCYGADALTSRKAAFMRLLEARVAEKVMSAADGPAISAADIKKEAARIDAETRAPEILECIKKSLGGPGDRYLAVFVRPVLAESLFRTFLMNSRKVQAGPLEKIKKALKLSAAGKSFEAAARETGLVYSSSTYSMSESSSAVQAEPAGPGARWSPWEAEFIEKYLKGLKPGEKRKEPVETDYELRLVRLLSEEGGKWTFESVLAQKTAQEEWLKSVKKMKLEIADKELKDWIKSIKGNSRLFAVEVVE